MSGAKWRETNHALQRDERMKLPQSLRPLLLLPLILLAGGCHSTRVEEAEHHDPDHKPVSYLAAVARLPELHEEILSGPLVARIVPPAVDHHDETHEDEAHEDDVPIDALQEFSDVVGWLPALAADSELQEEPWNQVYEVSQELSTLLSQLTDLNADKRQEAYREKSEAIASHLATLREVADLIDDEGVSRTKVHSSQIARN